MKPPLTPPPVAELIKRHAGQLPEILERVGGQPLVAGKYRHWDTVRHLKPPAGLTTEQWWLGIKLARGSQYRQIPLQTESGNAFVYALPDPVLARLHAIDQRSAGRAEPPGAAVTPEVRERYILSSLIEEAINSSQLEGASTTRHVAREMLREGRRPRDEHERMILNNFLAMRGIRKMRGKPMHLDDILKLHKRVTTGTLDHPDAEGRLQQPGDKRIAVVDNTTGEVTHQPPPAESLPARMDALIRFANGDDESDTAFVHPLVRAIVLHFWMAYEHPFEDGNGRVARALFYWSMLRADYWLFEFISISDAIKQAPSQYARAFLQTETDDNDLTYFLLNQLDVIDEALSVLDEYLARKSAEIREVENMLRGRGDLNYRQLALLSHSLRHPGHVYTIRSHQNSHGVAYATARSDLFNLADRSLLERARQGKRYVFQSPADIQTRLQQQCADP